MKFFLLLAAALDVDDGLGGNCRRAARPGGHPGGRPPPGALQQDELEDCCRE